MQRTTAWRSWWLALLPMVSLAQEPLFMDAATHPGARQPYVRGLVFAAGKAGSGDRLSAVGKMAYGLRSDLALTLDLRTGYREMPTEIKTSLERLGLKYRFMQRDIGPLNTWRASLLAGVAVPAAYRNEPDRVWTRGGIVTTAILGRHGLNGQLDWRGRFDDEDVLALHVSHLYRLAPARYSHNTSGAWYTMLEALNSVNARGDGHTELAAGLLYEARRWAAECGLALPVNRKQDQTDYRVGVGLRFLP